MSYDFSGWATRNNLQCSDGRTILRDAFKDNDGQTVPLVWNHQHNDPNNVLGHALLENRKEGVYAYCTFNKNESGQTAKELVDNGDVTALSIYANRLKQQGGNVLHGAIREVSLVLAGANPGAFIDSVMSHGDMSDDEAIIYTGYQLEHADEEEKTGMKKETEQNAASGKTVGDVLDSMTDEQRNAVYVLIAEALKQNGIEPDQMEHSDESAEGNGTGEETVGDVISTLSDEQAAVVEALLKKAQNDDGRKLSTEAKQVFETLTDTQKNAVYFLIGNVAEGQDNGEADEEEEEPEMKHNVFDNEETREDTLSHSEMSTIIGDAKRYGSLKESFLNHADEYGIEQIDYLFPDAKTLNNTPEFIKRDTGWVSKVMNGVHHSPFSRIKSIFADITEDEARAKGYIKGKLKKEEVFSLLKRTTTPTTVYKKQKMDRDDVTDITDFDVIAWLKSEMRMMLDEELARAFLFGDGRLSSSDDKINESNIRPIISDDTLYNIKYQISDVIWGNSADEQTAYNFIISAIKARKDYKGSGNPTLFTTEDMLTNMLLLTDSTGRDLYADEAQLAKKLRVKEIVTVPVMETLKDADSNPILGLIVNLDDYNVGADKGGSVNMFDDFDIDYNQQKYLIETRCSGALVKPYSAITLYQVASK